MGNEPPALVRWHILFLDRLSNCSLSVRSIDNGDQLRGRPFDVVDGPGVGFGRTLGWIGKGIPARSPRRWMRAWKLLGAIGAPRSEVNTCVPGGCSRCNRRRALSSSPCIGWTLGVPGLLLRTCRRPVASSTWCHCRSQTSEARRPEHCNHARGLYRLLGWTCRAVKTARRGSP
jgi:hypothetical protein